MIADKSNSNAHAGVTIHVTVIATSSIQGRLSGLETTK